MIEDDSHRPVPSQETSMRTALTRLAILTLLAPPLSAQTADDIIARYVKTVGGMERIQAVTTLRRSGRFTGGGGFEATVVQESKRPNKVRQEFVFQGMTGVNAYDGKTGWKIEPWQGKKDPEALSEEEMKSIVEDADFDEPLVNYQQKANKVELVGMDQVQGSDVFKLKVTLASGDVRYYYLDTDYYVPIKIEMKRMIRGAEQEFEMSLGDYKAVAGWYLPYSIETRRRGSDDAQKITYRRIEANVPIDDRRFAKPVTAGGGGPNDDHSPDGSPRRVRAYRALGDERAGSDDATSRAGEGGLRNDLWPRRPQHRVRSNERPRGGPRRSPRRGAPHGVRRGRERRGVEVRQRRHDLQTGVRPPAGAIHRRHHHRSQESAGGVGRHRGGVDAQQHVHRGRRLQVRRRRREL